jgi:hypothetical protein
MLTLLPLASPDKPGDTSQCRQPLASFRARTQLRGPVRRNRDSRLLLRLLCQAREQDREFGLAARIRFRQDHFKIRPDGFDTDPLVFGNFSKIPPAGKADCDSRLRRREAERLPQDGFRRFAVLSKIYEHDYGLGAMRRTASRSGNGDDMGH